MFTHPNPFSKFSHRICQHKLNKLQRNQTSSEQAQRITYMDGEFILNSAMDRPCKSLSTTEYKTEYLTLYTLLSRGFQSSQCFVFGSLLCTTLFFILRKFDSVYFWTALSKMAMFHCQVVHILLTPAHQTGACQRAQQQGFHDCSANNNIHTMPLYLCTVQCVCIVYEYVNHHIETNQSVASYMFLFSQSFDVNS